MLGGGKGRRDSERWTKLVNAVGGAHLMSQAARNRVYRLGGIEVGEGTAIFAGVVFRPGPVLIGAGCFINHFCAFDPGRAGITLEDNVSVATGVLFCAGGHEMGPSSKRGGANVSEPILVGRGAAIGANTIILPGVTIGRGCFVGAGSVVTRDTKEDSVYVGAPARWQRDLPTD